MSFEYPLKLVKTTVASGIIGRSPSTMAKDRMRGTGCEYVKHGASVRYDVRVLEKYAAEHTRRSTSEGDSNCPAHPVPRPMAKPPAPEPPRKRGRPAKTAPLECGGV
jgi:hypothetical protein